MTNAIIDLGRDVPPTLAQVTRLLRNILFDETGQGLANYQRIFGPRWLKNLGVTPEQIATMREQLSPAELDAQIATLAQHFLTSPQEFIAALDEAGIAWALVSAKSYAQTAEFVATAPDRLKGMFIANPQEDANTVVNLEQAVQEQGCVAFHPETFNSGVPASDAIFLPLYEKSAELDIPVFIYTAMNYRTDLPMDMAHPIHIDRIARQFPTLKIVASYGGWPWIPDLVGVARRHVNVFISMDAHRPKHFTTRGSGWEMLLQFGNTLLQDQILFASGADELGLPINTIVAEMKQLPLKPIVLEKWLYHNACRLFDCS